MKSHKFNRRKFIKSSSLTALLAGLNSRLAFTRDEKMNGEEAPVIKEYRRFGRTGFQVSDFSSGNPSNEAVLKALLKRGVNLIDTGEIYANGNSERMIGEVLKEFDRTKIFINSKLYSEGGFPSKEDVIERTNKCLERLGTGYVDCMQIHSAGNTQILKDEAFHAAMEQLKKEGKVHYVGVSCHGNNWAYDNEENLEKILLSAVDDGRFDVFLMAYNFVNADMAEKVLNACEQKNIATIIMKSNPIYIYGLLEGRVNRLAEEGQEVDEYTQRFYDKYKVMQQSAERYFADYGITDEREIMLAASRYVLSNPKAHTTAWDFRSYDDIDLMLGLSGQRLGEKDKLVLEGYNEFMGPYTCRIGCSDCEIACPYHMRINAILRYNYYFSAKKRQKYAMTKFARLQNRNPSELCRDCEGYCETACRYGVQTRSLLAVAQSNLELIT